LGAGAEVVGAGAAVVGAGAAVVGAGAAVVGAGALVVGAGAAVVGAGWEAQAGKSKAAARMIKNAIVSQCIFLIFPPFYSYLILNSQVSGVA